jgi:hypothetical protein
MSTILQSSPPAAAAAALLALLSAALGAAPVQAGPAESLTLFGGLEYVYDDNLFRLPDGQRQDGQRSDTARRVLAGFHYDHHFRRQKLILQAKLTQVSFAHFDQLDYDGKDFLAKLNWQLGNTVDGTAGASYVRTLAPYADFRSSLRNVRTFERRFLDTRYELSVLRSNERTEELRELGLDYTARSGSTAGLVARRIDGQYLNPRIIGTALLNDQFTQDELLARVLWKPTEISSVNLRAGYARRTHPVQSARDASGFNGRLGARTSVRSSLHVNAAAWREFSAIESDIVNFSLKRGVSVGASWDATAKVRVDAALSHERRSYEGVLPGMPADMSDTLRLASLGAHWKPRDALEITTSVSHQRRSGAEFLGNGSFKANVVSVTATVQF